MPSIRDRFFSADELLQIPDEERFELWDGKLRERVVGTKACWIAGNVASAVLRFAEHRSLGFAFGGGLGLQIAAGRPNTVLRVSGAFLAAGRIPNDTLPDGHLTVAPELAILVNSPHDEADYVAEKTGLLLDSGVRLVWVINPGARNSFVHRANGTVSVVRDDGALDGEDVLPGFSLPLARVLGPRVPEPVDA